MPPIRESGQRSARASAAVDLRTSSCISGTAATNAARCEWETDMEKRVSATEQGMSATEQRVSATEQGMSATEQRVSATEQRISATEQRVSATEQGMSATEQRVSATEQGMSATEQRVSATEQRISATDQIGRDTRRELGEIRELLQAALPNAANVGAATASCTQEAIMANTNTGIVGYCFVDRSTWYYIRCCHHIDTCSCVRENK